MQIDTKCGIHRKKTSWLSRRSEIEKKRGYIFCTVFFQQSKTMGITSSSGVIQSATPYT